MTDVYVYILKVCLSFSQSPAPLLFLFVKFFGFSKKNLPTLLLEMIINSFSTQNIGENTKERFVNKTVYLAVANPRRTSVVVVTNLLNITSRSVRYKIQPLRPHLQFSFKVLEAQFFIEKYTHDRFTLIKTETSNFQNYKFSQTKIMLKLCTTHLSIF